MSDDKCVHTEHCCHRHGCKYGNKDCPVENGTKKQSYDCEYCADDPKPTLSDLKEALTEHGMVAVPLEPTEAMIEGFWGEITHGEEERIEAIKAYKDMLAATKDISK